MFKPLSNTPIIETPLSVSVLTEERINDLGVLTVQDALGYVSGLYNDPFGLDTRGDWSIVGGVAPAGQLLQRPAVAIHLALPVFNHQPEFVIGAWLRWAGGVYMQAVGVAVQQATVTGA